MRYVMGEQHLAFALLSVALTSLVYLVVPSGSGSAFSDICTTSRTSVAHLVSPCPLSEPTARPPPRSYNTKVRKAGAVCASGQWAEEGGRASCLCHCQRCSSSSGPHHVVGDRARFGTPPVGSAPGPRGATARGLGSGLHATSDLCRCWPGKEVEATSHRPGGGRRACSARWILRRRESREELGRRSWRWGGGGRVAEAGDRGI